MGTLDGRRAIVTGAGSGIGRAVCLQLAADGAAVAALDIDGESARATAALCGGTAVVADVGDTAALDAAVHEAVAALGGLSILVNNAGVGNVRPFERYRDADYDRVVDASMRGTFAGIRAAGPLIRSGGGGSIVNIASVAGMRPTRGEAPYGAAKAAVIALTSSAALEYAPTVRVNCVSPGLIETPLTAPLLADEAARRAFDESTPLGRVGTAQDVADVVAFLCSDRAAYVTGVNIPVDGGSLLPSAQVDASLRAILSRFE